MSQISVMSNKLSDKLEKLLPSIEGFGQGNKRLYKLLLRLADSLFAYCNPFSAPGSLQGCVPCLELMD